MKEEAGLDIPKMRLFFQKSNVDNSKNKQFVTLVFYAKTYNTNVTINPEEHNALAWIMPVDIKKYNVVDYLPDCLGVYGELVKI